MQRAIVLCLAVAACRQPEATYPPIAVPCNDARIGNVIVEGGGPEDVPQLAVLAGTLDNAARTARVAAASEELLHARGYPGAAVRVARRPGCGVDLVVEVDKGPRYRIGHVSLEAGELDVYDDARLQRYVQRIADRLARGANVERSPRVVIGDHDSTYAAFGERIVIGRMTIERLASEAELAAIAAHELVHIEAGHTALAELPPGDDSDWLAARRDAEAIADERAVVLLERAGYVPTAMSRALAATLDVDDEEHPPRAERLANVAALAAGRTRGFEGRDEYLRHVENMVVGPNTRLGVRVEDAWVIAVLGLAVELRARDVVHVDGEALVLRNGRARFTAYPIGADWARELASELVDRTSAPTRLGSLTVGIAGRPRATGATALASLEHELLPQPEPGTWVVVLERPRGGLVIEISAATSGYTRDRWLAALRAATPAELAAAEPPHVVLHRATRAAKIADLITTCPDARAALRLDDPDRRLAPGEPFKCTDR